MLEEFKIDLEKSLKYMVKLLKEVRRRKIMLYSLCLALVSGYLLFNFDENSILELVFVFSASIALYNFVYPIYMKFVNFFNRFKKK
jgi:uncharacterized membrane protein YjjP (DUF1212 family)